MIKAGIGVLFVFLTLQTFAQPLSRELIMTGRQLVEIDPAMLPDKGPQFFTIFPAGTQSVSFFIPFTGRQTFRLHENGLNYLFDLESMNRHAAENNLLFFKLNATLVSFSSVHRQLSWRVSVNEEAMGAINFERGLIALLSQGNTEEKAAVFALPAAANHYRSYNFSGAKTFNEALRAGLNMKVLFGKSWVDLQSQYVIETAADYRSVDVAVSGEGRVSAPVRLQQLIDKQSEPYNWSNYLFSTSNPGIAIDAAVHYQFGPLSFITAGINNLGLIYWNRNTTTFTANGSHRWDGIELSGPLGFESLGDFSAHPDVEAFRDSFLNRILVPEAPSFVAMLPPGLGTAFWHYYKPKLLLGIFAESMLLNRFIRFNTGFTAIYQSNNYWSFSTGMHVSNRGVTQLPLGIAYRSEGLKASLVVQNLLHPLFPGRVRGAGGSLNLAFVFNKVRLKGTVNSKTYPFYRKF